jgi:acyl-CoA reductase-like NAD-dependent aldehyde dehydrogenase
MATRQVENLKLYIDGKWVESESGRTFPAENPATGEVIAHLAEGTREDARRAVAAAKKNKDKIAKLSIWERSRMCLRIADVIERRKEEMARILSEDQGKPLHTEAQWEVRSAIENFREAAEHIKWLEGATIPTENPNKRVFTFRQPRGVYAVITPWNFPLNIPIEYLGPGLAAGNAIVWAPAPTTSVIAVKLMECIQEADVPPGVVNLVTGPGPVVGDEIVAHPDTNAVGFTGSPPTGEHIARRAAGKPLLLELGGNGPTVILEDADPEIAARATARGAFLNAGQVCSATERILVDRRVHQEMAQRLVGEAQRVRLGDPASKQTTMGPLNNRPVAEKMDRHLDDGVRRGAKILFGGKRASGFKTELYYEPTVVDNVTPESVINYEETFGPIVPLMPFDDYDHALEIANGAGLGLVASLFTRDVGKAFRIAEQLRAGIVNVNDSSNYWELHIPFGGVAGTRSGIGRLGGKYTIMEMSDLRTITIDVR